MDRVTEDLQSMFTDVQRGHGVMNDDARGNNTVECGQCWRVFMRSSQSAASVKVLAIDEHSVVLRDMYNFDLIARFAWDDVEFLRRLDQ